MLIFKAKTSPSYMIVVRSKGLGVWSVVGFLIWEVLLRADREIILKNYNL